MHHPFRRKLILGATMSCLLLAGGALAQSVSTILIEQAWVRPTVPGQQAGGGFLTVRNTGGTADRLIGGRTPAAERLELHSMKMEGDVMKMQQVQGVDIPAGQVVEFKPGSFHVMLMGLKAPLKAGTSVPVTLKFEKAGELTVDMKVQASAAQGGEHHHH